MSDFGNKPGDPLHFMNVVRTVPMRSDNSYPDQDGPATPNMLRVTGAGTVNAGALSISIQNKGAASGKVLGQTLMAGEAVTFNAPGHAGLGPVSYDGTNTTLLITWTTTGAEAPDPAFTQDPRGVGGFEGV